MKKCWIRSNVIEKPTEDNTDMHIVLEPNVVSGNDVLTVEGSVPKHFRPHTLFSGYLILRSNVGSVWR